jgi:hypothetical protein
MPTTSNIDLCNNSTYIISLFPSSAQLVILGKGVFFWSQPWGVASQVRTCHTLIVWYILFFCSFKLWLKISKSSVNHYCVWSDKWLIMVFWLSNFCNGQFITRSIFSKYITRVNEIKQLDLSSASLEELYPLDISLTASSNLPKNQLMII